MELKIVQTDDSVSIFKIIFSVTQGNANSALVFTKFLLILLYVFLIQKYIFSRTCMIS